MRRASVGRVLLAVLIVAVTFYFLGRSLVRNWKEVAVYFSTLHFRWWLLAPALLAYTGSFLVFSWAWCLILRRFGERLSLAKSMGIVAYSTLGKYLPGKVWALLGRVYMAGQEGVQARHAAASVVIETAYMLIAALVLFLVSLPWYPRLMLEAYLLLLLLPVALALIWPPVFNRLVNFLLCRMKQEPIRLELKVPEALGLLVLYLGSWLMQGLAFFFLTWSFAPLALRDLAIFPGAFALSWTIGLIVIWAPGGLGVREGLFALLLGPVLPGALNVVTSLLSRVWVTLFELLTAAVVFVISRFRRRNGS